MAGPLKVDWAGRGKEERELGSGWFVGFWVSFPISPFLFLIQSNTKLGEFKFKFEFTTSTQTTKAMHQHECINKVLTLDKILIT